MSTLNEAWTILTDSNVPGGATIKRVEKLSAVLERLSSVDRRRIRIVATRRSGSAPKRYGIARGRSDYSAYIGRSRARGGVEIWAVWNDQQPHISG
jgi:hypothetical protein